MLLILFSSMLRSLVLLVCPLLMVCASITPYLLNLRLNMWFTTSTSLLLITLIFRTSSGFFIFFLLLSLKSQVKTTFLVLKLWESLADTDSAHLCFQYRNYMHWSLSLFAFCSWLYLWFWMYWRNQLHLIWKCTYGRLRRQGNYWTHGWKRIRMSFWKRFFVLIHLQAQLGWYLPMPSISKENGPTFFM